MEWMPKMFPLPPTANRDFCIAMLKAKVEGLIGNEGDSIGWEEDKLTVGPLAFAAKQSLLRFIPLMLPEGDDEVLYRLVLQHDDFGIHNMSVDVDEAGEPSLTSVYDWETGCIVPIILTEIEFSIAGCDLIVDEKGEPSVHIRSDLERGPERRLQNQQYSVEFLNVCPTPFSDVVSQSTCLRKLTCVCDNHRQSTSAHLTSRRHCMPGTMLGGCGPL